MRNIILLFILLACSVPASFAQAPIAAIYPAVTTVVAGNSSVITPLNLPENVTAATASAGNNFKGTISVNPANGIVTVTDARPVGVYLVHVSVYNSESSSTATFTLTVTGNSCSQGLFLPAINSAVSSLPFAVVTGDFNSDGKQDIATANYGLNNISVRLGNGTGGFSNAGNFPTGTGPQSIAIGDFNGDGKPDLATANFLDNSISVLTGNGAGGFNLQANIPGGNYPYAIAAGDFNNDGWPDLATVNYGSNSIAIRLGNGTGNFGVVVNVAVGAGPRAIVIADFNADGHADLATANFIANNITVKFGDGTGDFTGTINLPAGTGPHSITNADFNNDGFQDLAVSNYSSNNISIKLGNGTGSFSSMPLVYTGNSPRTLITGDFNGDNKQDIAVVNTGDNTVIVKRGDGLGGFAANAPEATDNNPYSLAAGDFNADGKQDIAVANAGNASVSVLLGEANNIAVEGNGLLIVDGSTATSETNHTDFGNVLTNLTRIFTIRNTSAVSLTVNNIALGGQDADLFSIANITLPAIIQPGGTLTFSVTFVPNNPGIKSATITINNNNCIAGVYDFAVTGTAVLSLTTLGNYAPATVTAGGNIIIQPSGAPVNAGNITAFTSSLFRGQLQVDTATGNVNITNAHPAGTYNITIRSNGVNSVQRNFVLTVNNSLCSQGLFTASAFGGEAGMQSIAIGDFNKDGKQDIVTASHSNSNVSVRLNNGNNGFATAWVMPVGNAPKSVAIADINGDGYTDIITANSGSNTVSVLLATGTTGFSSSADVPVGNAPVVVVIADFNEDGKPDLATVNYLGNDISVRYGNGLGAFIGSGSFTAGNFPKALACGDFNADGHIDIAVLNEGSNNISIRLGDGNGQFGTSNNTATGSMPASVYVADINNDGKQDLLVCNSLDNTVMVFTGIGNGTFNTPVLLTVGHMPVAVAAADVNGDGKNDVITVNANDNSITVRQGDGLGGFATSRTFATGNMPAALATGDFNEDGRYDLIIANSASTDFTQFMADLNGINVSGNDITIADGSQVTQVADGTNFADVTNSAAQQFIISNPGNVNLTVKTILISGADSSNFSAGNINLPVTIAAGTSVAFTVTFAPQTAGLKNAVISINSDNCDHGNYHFAVQGNGIALVPVLPGYPASSVVSGGNVSILPAAIPVNVSGITAHTSLNFKGGISVDPLTGIVSVVNAHPAGTYTITVKATGVVTVATSFILTVTNNICSPGIFNNTATPGAGLNPGAVVAGDFNGDGKQDILCANQGSNNVSVLLGDGNGTFTTGMSIPTGAAPRAIAAADFNGDGKQDFVTANYGGSSISIRLGDGNGNFTGNTDIPVGPYPASIIPYDFNGDGKKDLAIAIVGTNNVALYVGDGTGNFNMASTFLVGSGPFSIVAGDFNEDGKPDIATANYNTNNVSILAGNGTYGFNTMATIDVGGNPFSIVSADFDNDGKTDLATANYYSNTVTVLLGNGNNVFTESSTVAVMSGPAFIVSGDFNGDGKQDFATANYNANTVSVRFGNGTGNFNTSPVVNVGSKPQALAAGDFNGDGKHDLVTANSNSNSLSVMINNANEINVLGNGITITDGSTITGNADNTDFGTGNSVTHGFSIQNKGTAVLTIADMNMSGVNANQFTINGITLPVSVLPGNSVSFNVNFHPDYSGIKNAIVNIMSDDCDEPVYDFAVKGEFECTPATLVINGLAPAYCMNAATVTISGNQSAGALFSGNGIIDQGNGTAGFTAALAGEGIHVISYTYTDMYGCVSSINQTVQVNPLPVVEFAGLASTYCSNSSMVTLTGIPAGGVFSGSGIVGDYFDPAAVGVGGPYTITYTYTNTSGCTSSQSQQVMIVYCPTYAILDMKLMLQGPYRGAGVMAATIYDLGISTDPSETDTVTVSLWSPLNLAEAVPGYSINTVLHTDGMLHVEFPASAIGANYYISVKHRNHIETWSHDPVMINAVNMYDFTTGLNMAYDDQVNPPMIISEDNLCLLYAGDINQDGGIDGLDMNVIDNEVGFYGYNLSDINGDGGTDGLDMNFVDNNSQLGLFYARPY